MDSERFQRLLDRHFDQVLSAEERIEFERTLLESPRARETFWEQARFHGLLRHWGESEWGREEMAALLDEPSEKPAVSRSVYHGLSLFSRWAVGATGVLVLAAMVALLVHLRRQSSSESQAGLEERAATASQFQPEPVLLARSLDARWGGSEVTPFAGEMLRPGKYQLLEGLLRLEFSQGPHLLVEGPAEFETADAGGFVVHSGRYLASVPEAAGGFLIRPPGLVVELNPAELGLSVIAGKSTEVHVFSGTAGCKPVGTGLREFHVMPGQGAVFDGSESRVVAANRELFPDEVELQNKERQIAMGRYQAWKTQSAGFASRNDLLVYLDFESEVAGGRSLVNRARHQASASVANLVGCDWVEGRWLGKKAVEFKHSSDRLWLKVDGSFEALTFLAWVRVDSLPYNRHSLFLARSGVGKLNWTIHRDGALDFGIEVPRDGRSWLSHRSSTRILPGQLGSWLCLATVYAQDGAVTHFINGEPAGSGRLAERGAGRLGTCEIGNSLPVTPDVPDSNAASVRGRRTETPGHFHGRLDEFVLFNAAMDAAEIRRLHSVGRDARSHQNSPISQKP